MSSLEQLCPASVLRKSPFFDTLVAYVPHRGRGSVEVEVPPLFGGRDSDWVAALQRSARDSIPRGGLDTGVDYREPPAAPAMQAGQGRNAPSWDGPEERDELVPFLASAANEIIDNKNRLDPRARDAVVALANMALQKLDQIKRIYERYDSFVIPTNKDARGSAFARWGRGAKVGPITLRDSLREILQWSEPWIALKKSDRERQFRNLLDRFGTEGTEDLLVLGSPSLADYQSAMRQIRERDRAKIHTLFNEAVRAIWCAQYGVAQSQSYRANLATDGMMLQAMTPWTPTAPAPGTQDPDADIQAVFLTGTAPDDELLGPFPPEDDVAPPDEVPLPGQDQVTPEDQADAEDLEAWAASHAEDEDEGPRAGAVAIGAGLAVGGAVIMAAGALMNRA